MATESPKVVDLRNRLARLLDAEAQILENGQELTVGQGSTARRFTRANLGEVRQAVEDLQGRIDVEVAGSSPGRRRGRLMRIIPGGGW